MNQIDDNIDGTIEVELSKSQTPLQINLYELFGAQGLTFRAAVENYGIVDMEIMEDSGIIALSACPECLNDQSTRLAVRAVDEYGDSVVAVLAVIVRIGERTILRAS